MELFAVHWIKFVVYTFVLEMNQLHKDVLDLVRLTTGVVLQRCIDRIREDVQASRKKRRECWVRPWLQRRHQLGAYDTLMIELANEDVPGYVAFQRLAPDLFAELLSKVGPLIQKTDTVKREAISPGARLSITLCFLATGKFKNLFQNLYMKYKNLYMKYKYTCLTN